MSDRTPPTLDETIEWVEQYHYRMPVGYCALCGEDWPCKLHRLADAVVELRSRPTHPASGAIDYPRMISEQSANSETLRDALESLVLKCEAEGCGTAWAPITEARRLLADFR